MLKRPPTRLELRGEGADQLEQEFQEALHERTQAKRQQQAAAKQQAARQAQQAKPSARATPAVAQPAAHRTPAALAHAQGSSIPASAAALALAPSLDESSGSDFFPDSEATARQRLFSSR